MGSSLQDNFYKVTPHIRKGSEAPDLAVSRLDQTPSHKGHV